MRYLVTGGCGFIGSNFIRELLSERPDCKVLNVDKLTYAGNPENLADVAHDPRYEFRRADICDAEAMQRAFGEFRPEAVVNFAAESHVDRSIEAPDAFIRTDVFGVYTLLEAARDDPPRRFVQVSTDEVYGSIAEGAFSEHDELRPSSPYSASKAAGDRLAFAYHQTYGLPVVIARPSNTFGPYQYPEKLIPLFVTNALEGKSLPLYGDGKNVRDWLYVRDHCAALRLLVDKGEPGEAYNVGGDNERQNREITRRILDHLGCGPELIRHVEDRLGHDRRYALDSSKILALGWAPSGDFEQTLAETIDWYREHREWWHRIKSGDFLEYYRAHYGPGEGA